MYVNGFDGIINVVADDGETFSKIQNRMAGYGCPEDDEVNISTVYRTPDKYYYITL